MPLLCLRTCTCCEILQEMLGQDSGSNKALDKRDIRAIRAGPPVLHFGTIATLAETTQHFCLTNTLQHPIHVLVDAKSHDHLLRSSNLSQVGNPFIGTPARVILPYDSRRAHNRAPSCRQFHQASLRFSLSVSAAQQQDHSGMRSSSSSMDCTSCSLRFMQMLLIQC